MELIEKLGIDWRLLLAQIVNFLVLFFVLTKFVFKPLIKFLDERSQKIDESLVNADKIQKNLEEAVREKEAIILASRHEAQDILVQAKQQAEELQQTLRAEAQTEVAKILENGRAELVRDRKEMNKELKEEVVELVAEATKRLLSTIVDERVDREYVNKILSKV